MRTPIYVLVAALFFGGCTHYHVTPAGSPQPDRVEAPAPEPIEPLELDIGRPHGSQLLLQTNRPAYVAIFEIIPNRGVTLIYPAAAHQQNMLVSGLTWVPLWWSPRRASFNSDRYIYAVASEEPLRLSGETFQAGYFHRILGLPIYRAESPYTTMRAISRTVVPDVAEEEWAEDVHIITPTYLTDVYRMVRIHCPGGRVYEVPEEMAGRIWCPTRTRVVIVDGSRPRTRDYPVGRPVRPDSVFGPGGGRVKIEPRRRGPIARVIDPTGRDRDDNRRDPRRAGRDDRDNRRDDRDEDSEKPVKPKSGRVIDLIRAKQERDAEKAAKEAEKEREKQERENRRREAEDARRREAEEREARRREEEERRDDRKDERRDERDARKDERDDRKDDRRDEREERKEERKEERRDEPKREEPRREEPKREEPKREEPKREEPKREEPKQQGQPREEKREEPKQEKKEESRDDNKGRRSVRDLLKDKKEKP